MDAQTAKEILATARIEVIQGMTQPTKPGKQPRPVWNIVGNTKPYEHLIYEMSIKAKKWKGTLSCWEDPTEELAEAIQKHGKMSFAERKEYEQERAEVRADRLEERARNHSNVASAAYQKQKSISSLIPFGQPILIGHHSEGRHRRDLARIDNNRRKFVEESQIAESLRDRAEYNRDKAKGEYSLYYLSNRLNEANKRLRKVELSIQGKRYTIGGGTVDNNNPPSEEDKVRLELVKAEIQEEVAYWQEQIKAKGGGELNKNTIAKGDWVFHRGTWKKVFRVNAKTLSLKYNHSGRTLAAAYEEIKLHCPKDKALAYAQSQGIDLSGDDVTSTSLDLKEA